VDLLKLCQQSLRPLSLLPLAGGHHTDGSEEDEAAGVGKHAAQGTAESGSDEEVQSQGEYEEESQDRISLASSIAQRVFHGNYLTKGPYAVKIVAVCVRADILFLYTLTEQFPLINTSLYSDLYSIGGNAGTSNWRIVL
jgi:hypothetical protein